MKVITYELHILYPTTNIIMIKYEMDEVRSTQRSNEKFIHFSTNCEGAE
jgi:hypothetical protein